MKSISRAPIARPEKRFLGFIFDYAIITLLRLITFKICMITFLESHINTFVKETVTSTGTSFFKSKILKQKMEVNIDTTIFTEIVLVIIAIILIAPLYNVLTIKFKMLKTTIGKKLFAIYPQTLDGKDVGILRIICHYVISTLPILPIAAYISADVFNRVYGGFLQKNQALEQALKMADINVKFYAEVPTITVIISIITLLFWYGIVFFTKDKLTGHDFICKTKFVSNGNGAKPFNIPFVYEFGRKILDIVRPMVNKITKK